MIHLDRVGPDPTCVSADRTIKCCHIDEVFMTIRKWVIVDCLASLQNTDRLSKNRTIWELSLFSAGACWGYQICPIRQNLNEAFYQLRCSVHSLMKTNTCSDLLTPEYGENYSFNQIFTERLLKQLLANIIHILASCHCSTESVMTFIVQSLFIKIPKLT